jgi:NADH-quinone oxidoreductase subunit G
MMIKIQIDGKYYEVQPEKNLLETCLALGFDVPYFCFHPALDSVGACRLCAVKKFANPDDKKGKIVMSCMEQVRDGLIISLEDTDVKAFRASILESLMTNHPHDCPICDEGGECHLQDMTVMTGHDYRRFVFRKRTYLNQFLGPFINHEMNRCIQCYRCVRFYKDYAGGKDFDVFGSSNKVYFGRQSEGILENEFSGNLVEVCPTGVFTDKTLKDHYARKWDMTHAPSVCVHCSLGCNTIAGERYGSLRRILSRYNGSVNGYFLCDRGRFGYEFVLSDTRIRKVMARPSKDKDLSDSDAGSVQPFLVNALSGNKKIIGIGSPRASLEANYALSVLVGKENFCHGISRGEHILIKNALGILKDGPVYTPTLKEIEKADAVLILGEDLTNTAPMMALALRQAARNKSVDLAVKLGVPRWHDSAVREIAQDMKSPVFIATPFITKLDDLAEEIFRASPGDIARLGFAVASVLDDNAPKVKDLAKEDRELAEKIALTLKGASRPLIISGIHSKSEEILQASADIATALHLLNNEVGLSFVFPECNSAGLGMMDGTLLDDAMDIIIRDGADTLVILENDLYRKASKDQIDRMLGNCRHVIVADHLMNETTSRADILLPAGTFAESEGTLVSNEGRAQRYYSVFPVNEPVRESWRWMRDLIQLSNRVEDVSWQNFDEVVAAMITDLPVFGKLREYIPGSDHLMLNEKIPRQTMRYSGRTAMNAHINVSEPGIPADPDSPLAFTMEGKAMNIPSPLIPFYWSPGWNSPQAINKYLDEPGGSVKGGDPGIRLIETGDGSRSAYFTGIPESFKPKKDEWFIIPVYRIFGSEELSSISRAISSRIKGPFIMLNEKDAKKLDIQDDDLVQLDIDKESITIKLKIEGSLPDGLAGVTCQFPGMAYMDLPGWGKVTKA